jgi:hypothetical protein
MSGSKEARPDAVAAGRAVKGHRDNGVNVAKAFATLQARFALRGFTLWQQPSGTFVVSRWNLMREFDSEAEVEHFAQQVGA